MSTSLIPLLSAPWVTKACQTFQENKTWKALGVEVLGINLPKTAIVRTKNEAIDVGFNEFGNTVGFFGGLWGGGYLLDRFLAAKKIRIHANPAILSKGRVMKSFALIPPLVAFMAAMPFFRNAFTAWRSGSVAYQDLITKGQPKRQDSTAQQKTKLAIQNYLQTGATILAAGAALGLTGFFWARSSGSAKLFQGAKLIPALNKPWMHKALKAICLTGNKATEFEDLRAVAYWGAPAYLGWMAASRDRFEIKEQALKLINFVAVYLLTDKITHRFFDRKTRAFAKAFPKAYTKTPKGFVFSYSALKNLQLPKKSLQKLLSFENTKILSGFGMTVLLMAVIPALLNIHLTRQRLANAASATPQNNPVYDNPLRRQQGYNPLS